MDKSSFRTEYLQKRKDLDAEEITKRNDSILANTKLFVDGKSLKTIHVFLPQHGKNEIDTWKIIGFLSVIDPEIRILTPRVIPGTREMEHFLLTSETKLIDSRWKIPEPDPATSLKISPQEIDAVLIPLLAFDKNGYRVGYGGGFYDRFLPQCRTNVMKVGLSCFEADERPIDIDSFDIKMDYCITPQAIIKF